MIGHRATSQELEGLKNSVGTYQAQENYSQIVDGHGTGLRPPSEQQWKELAASSEFIDNVTYQAGLPSSVDESKTPYFPPIGNQGTQGSCIAWSFGYYTKTFQEAEEHNWDLSGATWQNSAPSPQYQSKIMSPAFIYNLLNGGVDNGLYYGGVTSLISNIGCCTYDKMPYNVSDYISWPTEIAWTQAALYRSDQSGMQYMSVNTDEGIASLKAWVASGHLATISVDANKFTLLSSADVLTSDTYTNPQTNHAGTIVGYDDALSYIENGATHYGAFKVANSWGIGGWEHVADGFYWVSYGAMKQDVTYCMYYNDLTSYKPDLLASFSITHTDRAECSIQVGIGNPQTTNIVKTFTQYVSGGNHSFCDNNIVLDITEFKTLVSNAGSQSYFLAVHDSGTSITGVINSFSINGVASSNVPCRTVDGTTVYVTVNLAPPSTPSPPPPTPTPTITPTVIPPPTPTPTATPNPSPTATPTPTATPSPTQTIAPTPTPTPTTTASPTITPTPTPTPTSTPTVQPTQTTTPSAPAPTAQPTTNPTVEPSQTHNSPPNIPSNQPTPKPTQTPTTTPSNLPSVKPEDANSTAVTSSITAIAVASVAVTAAVGLVVVLRRNSHSGFRKSS